MTASRFVTALSLLLLVLTHALALTAVRLRFEWRRAEIEQTLCENRNRPELGCHGSCVLRKELQAASDTTGGLLRLGSDTLADLFLPAAPLVLAFAPAAAEWHAEATWPRPRAARVADGFGQAPRRPPAPLMS